MKNLFQLYSLLALLLSVGLWSCQEDVDPEIQALAIDNFDLIQVTNTNPNVDVVISTSGNGDLEDISVKIMPDGSPTAIATNVLKKVTSGSLNRITVKVPFPLPETAPSGLYTIEYQIGNSSGEKTTKTYKVNILNYRTVTPDPCNFNALPPLPGGKNVYLRVTVPVNTNGEDVFISGNFEGTFGGCSDWSGGGCAALKLTKLSNTCYYIALNLTDANEFKITRGGWDRRMQNANGQDVDNLKWNGQATQDYTVGNWLDRAVLPVATLPAGAIQSGKITLVADVKSADDTPKYYLVKKGATSLAGAIQMLRVAGTTKMAAAVPKVANDEYVVVKDVIAKTGINSFGFDIISKIDGTTNPVNTSVGGFKTEFTPPTNITSLLLVGGSTPAGWNNSGSNTQIFTKVTDGKFTITANLDKTRPDPGFLFIAIVGDWSDNSKVGKTAGDTTGGTLQFGGGNYETPNIAGDYKIDVDLIAATYKLTKL